MVPLNTNAFAQPAKGLAIGFHVRGIDWDGDDDADGFGLAEAKPPGAPPMYATIRYAHSTLSGSTVGRYVFGDWSDSVTLVEVTAVQRRGRRWTHLQ